MQACVSCYMIINNLQEAAMAVVAAMAVKAVLKVRTPFLRQGFAMRC